MPKFYVEIEVVSSETFEYDDIEADNEELAVEIATERAQNETMLDVSDVYVCDIEELSE